MKRLVEFYKKRGMCVINISCDQVDAVVKLPRIEVLCAFDVNDRISCVKTFLSELDIETNGTTLSVICGGAHYLTDEGESVSFYLTDTHHSEPLNLLLHRYDEEKIKLKEPVLLSYT